jgi:hypothetical protein
MRLRKAAELPRCAAGLNSGLKKMRNHILVPAFAALALIAANIAPTTAKPADQLGVNAAKSEHHVGSYADNTQGKQQRIVVASKYDDGH